MNIVKFPYICANKTSREAVWQLELLVIKYIDLMLLENKQSSKSKYPFYFIIHYRVIAVHMYKSFSGIWQVRRRKIVTRDKELAIDAPCSNANKANGRNGMEGVSLLCSFGLSADSEEYGPDLATICWIWATNTVPSIQYNQLYMY